MSLRTRVSALVLLAAAGLAWVTLRHEPREASARSTEVRLGIRRSGLARDPIQMRVDDWTTSGDLAAAQGAATAGRQVADNDLTISGLFALQAGARVSDSASATAMMGVELAVDVRAAGNQYDLHAQLFSLPQRSLISEKTYHASDAILRRVTHQISDDVVFQLSGETGIAQSQIAFSNQAGAAREIYVADYDGFGAHAVTHDRNLDFSPALSADGRWLAYSSLRRQTYAIMLMELATGKERVLFEGAGSALSPSFSPDGERVAFATSRDGNHEIYVVRTDGTGLTRLTRSSAIDVQPTWSPDGRQIAFCSDRSGVAQIHVMSSDGTDLRRLSQGRTRAEAPSWSPKGTLVAYMARVNGTYDTHAVDASTGNDFNLTQGKGSDESPHWAANGRHLLVVAHRGGETGLYILNSESGETFRLPIRGDVETPAWYR